MEKSADAFRTISEVAHDLKLPQHVLRFWETRFPQVRPLKRGGNRRFYRPDDVELLLAIKTLLYGDGFTIKGVQRILKDRGPRAVAGMAHGRAGGEFDPNRPLADEDGSEAFADDAEDAVSIRPTGSGPEHQAIPLRVFDQLQAVLFEISECRRILRAVRD